MEQLVNASLIKINHIKAIVITNVKRQTPYIFTVLKNNIELEKITISKFTHHKDMDVIDIELANEFDFGHSYLLSLEGVNAITVSLEKVVEWDNFDELFYYEGNDLGHVYSKEVTNFNLWAPLASKVFLKLEENDSFVNYEMNRSEKGVYRISIKGDLKNKKYHFIVDNYGLVRETNDPYGVACNANSEYSVVVDLASLEEIKNVKPTNEIKNYVDATIYETNVRDFTEHKSTNIVNKGKYLGFIESNRKTKSGHVAGLDYLKELGITHVQLQPILDFRGVNDLDVAKSYNWGYDPISLFAIEGSYSTEPDNAIKRMEEFKTLVKVLHENNIRVIVDVVYNHIYDFINSSLERVVPNYYFRRTKDGNIANASGCGNDIKSERKMVRKMIKDSLLHLLNTFDVDGFRFDLMGLLDIKTINEAYESCSKIKPDIMFYGEGWDMGFELKADEKACTRNYAKMPNVAFFNDMYRNILMGSISKYDAEKRGYVNGNPDYMYGLDFVQHGSILPLSYEPMFDDANRTINYFECHDNFAAFDKMEISNKEEDKETLLKRIMLGNTLVMYSFGIPFIHSGQEIGLSKQGNDNTYNVTKLNTFNYDLLDERYEMVQHLKSLIKQRKELEFTKYHAREDIAKVFEIKHWDNKLYSLRTKQINNDSKYGEILILINDENVAKSFEFDDYYNYLGGYRVKNGSISPCSIEIFYKEKENESRS